MSQQDQLILVCEKLLGLHAFRPYDTAFPELVCVCGKSREAHYPLPPLTSDLIWECLLKLTDGQLDEYANKLSIITHNDLDNVQRLEWSVTKRILLASKEQRLAALVETIKDL